MLYTVFAEPAPLPHTNCKGFVAVVALLLYLFLFV